MERLHKITADFGGLTVGETPRVVGTLTTLDALRSFAQRYSGQCDVAEIRLDLIGEDADWSAPALKIQQAGTPTLLTLRTSNEGGRSKRSPLLALDLVKEAWSSIAAFDVEHERADAREAAKIAHAQGKAVVGSFHDFIGTPAREKLIAMVDAAGSYADVVKISTFVNNESDIAVLESLLERKCGKPLCVIGMGALGMKTRTEFPLRGSCLTYGYLDASAAPGQLAAAELMKRLRAAQSH